jgi:DNA repair protein RecN (Recombination protein N)
LAEHHQVIVITHLAQVAAFADTHVVVAKSTSGDGRVTRSDIAAVTGEDRVVELARMLSGHEDSGTARAHASELLAAAVVRR